MLFRTKAKKRCSLPIRNEAHTVHEGATPEEAELRRLMYERIAQGNALFDAEETAKRRWRGK